MRPCPQLNPAHGLEVHCFDGLFQAITEEQSLPQHRISPELDANRQGCWDNQNIYLTRLPSRPRRRGRCPSSDRLQNALRSLRDKRRLGLRHMQERVRRIGRRPQILRLVDRHLEELCRAPIKLKQNVTQFGRDREQPPTTRNASFLDFANRFASMKVQVLRGDRPIGLSPGRVLIFARDDLVTLDGQIQTNHRFRQT